MANEEGLFYLTLNDNERGKYFYYRNHDFTENREKATQLVWKRATNCIYATRKEGRGIWTFSAYISNVDTTTGKITSSLSFPGHSGKLYLCYDFH
jgi:hypothetical protein